MNWKKGVAIILVLFVVLLLTPFDEILIAAAFALGGIVGVLVFLALFALLFLFVIRRTRWGGRTWQAAERRVDRYLRR